ncbi:L-dopachrome tautomerase-related protein [Cryomorphaceae bacterium 1068]|nr:L-dopachrome tautomerase-related protein [Cryomorphaceae bacterium 1068]
MKFLRNTLITITLFLLVLAITGYFLYGGGEEYPDISTDPIYTANQLEEVFASTWPLGNVAATKDSTARLFFTVHPESRPDTFKLMEIIDGKARPYPSSKLQERLLTPLGLFTDHFNRLWIIDHGNHGFEGARLLAIDLSTDQYVLDYTFPDSVGKKLSFFNDLSVSPDGKHVAVANVSFFGKKPSLVIYHTETGESKNLLEGHESMRHEGYVPVTPIKKMRFFGGVADLLTGIDGIDFSRDGNYIYWAPMGSSGLYRIPTVVAVDFSKSEGELAAAIERVSDKPLSDGIRTDDQGNVYITDVENQGVYVVTPSGNGKTLIKDDRVQWADGLSLGGDGYFYLIDSEIPNQMMQSQERMRESAPYYIFRFRPLE